MSETANLGLPLVQAAQSQKHVTVNEALARLDAVSQLVIASRSLGTPPVVAPDGAAYAVPETASGAWAGEAGRLAFWINGGWDFLDPKSGWRGWIADESAAVVHDGATWVAGAVAVSAAGAALSFRVVEWDHAISAGSESVTQPRIPAGSVVFGVTGRVIEEIGGAASSLRVGIGPDATDRYGTGIGTAAGSWFRGIAATPVAYYADTALTITGEGGTLSGGTLRIAVHLLELSLPRT